MVDVKTGSTRGKARNTDQKGTVKVAEGEERQGGKRSAITSTLIVYTSEKGAEFS
jgi:hypothetical protein